MALLWYSFLAIVFIFVGSVFMMYMSEDDKNDIAFSAIGGFLGFIIYLLILILLQLDMPT